MKKILFACLLGLLTFTTAFVVYENVAPTSSEVCEDQYGGPIRRMFQHHRQRRQMRHQRDNKVEMFTNADGQQYVIEE
jgi:hypothetical protein